MREIRPSGSEGGVAHLRHPYPYPSSCRSAAQRWQRIPGIFLRVWAAKKANSSHAQEDVGNDKVFNPPRLALAAAVLSA